LIFGQSREIRLGVMMAAQLKPRFFDFQSRPERRASLRALEGWIMRNPTYALAALTIAAMSLPLAGIAQRFQEPTKEEL
jgi:hypothetical protein